MTPGTEVALHRIADYLDGLLEVSKFDEGEPSNGLMFDAGRAVTRVAAAVNTSFTSIKGAAESGADLLLVHHTTWASIDLQLKNAKEKALGEAGLSLYCAHAALDCHQEFSNAHTLADRLGIHVLGRFAPYGGGLAGAHGEVDGSFPEFVERVRGLLGVRVDAWENSETFGHVGLVPGGGPWTSMVEEARSLGCGT